jgi:hypothetical protein
MSNNFLKVTDRRKSRGGLTRGHGLHEMIRITRLSTMTNCTAIRYTLSNVVGLEQPMTGHVEKGASRI